MSRKLVKNDLRALEESPLFQESVAQDAPAADSAETADDAAPAADGDDDIDQLDAALQSLEEPAATTTAAPTPSARALPAPASLPSSLHGLWNAVGIALVVAGIVLALFAAKSSTPPPALLDALARIGLSPVLLLGFGLAAWGIGTLLGRQARQSEGVAQLETTLHDLIGVADQVDATTRALHVADTARAATAMSGDEFGQVLFALQRNEEKVSNLTKATKTFGKPLVEMTTQLAEVAAQAAQGQTLLQALRLAHEGGLNEVQDALRKQEETLRQQDETLRRQDEALRKQDDTLRKQDETLRKQDESLRKQGESRLPADLADLRHGLEELRTTLQRDLKAGPDTVQRHVQSLGTALESTLAANTQKLREGLDSVNRDLAVKLVELGKSAKEAGGKSAGIDLAPIQSAIADLRRDVASLGNHLARAPAGHAATAPAAAPAAAAAPASAAPATPAGEASPPAGLAQSIAGDRKAPAGNVLGAIAKLKKLRS